MPCRRWRDGAASARCRHGSAWSKLRWRSWRTSVSAAIVVSIGCTILTDDYASERSRAPATAITATARSPAPPHPPAARVPPSPPQWGGEGRGEVGRLAFAGSARGPADERGLSFGGEHVDAALDAGEPAIIIVQQDLRCRWYLDPELARPSRAGRQRRGAGERLLAVGGHDREPRAAAQRRVAAAPVVLVDETRAAPVVAARLPRAGLDQDIDAALCGDAEQAEAQQAAELAHARIALAPAPLGRAAHGEPHLVAGR